MKKNIAIVMGGYSSEHDISIKSGNIVYAHLSKEIYTTFRIVVTKNEWYYWDDSDAKIPVDRSNFTISLNEETIAFDAVFNTIHGTPGEDGLLQAYFELLTIPQTSCNHYTAAVTFNKRDCISILKAYHIPVAENYFINKNQPINIDEITSKVGLPCFVKANRSGSSFGVVKAHTKEAIAPALKEAFTVDNEVIIESFLSGTEISVGVACFNGTPTVLGITEIVTENDFFDYEAKYLGKSEEITPARLTTEQNKEVEALTLEVYKALNMKGFSRTDFIFNNGKPYFLEINTNPGLSEASILPQQSIKKGISLAELFANEVEECLKLHF
ncbi:D-alanine--D-alanine ligase [Aquimarina agarivorans]|uniref:D-alanine--D-alanine ligase n=1 Tax=Aquimarina agarivorans TaxID=980584 RepID=UPI0003183030|nr:D-alanine--D-alanine ligase [Aquimarina agarivorans]